MRHDWLLEVLEDLRIYAALNGLPATVVQIEDALRIAHAEVATGHDVMARPQSLAEGLGKRPN